MIPVTFDGNIKERSWRTSALTETPELLRQIRDDPQHFFLCGVGPGSPRWDIPDTPVASYRDTRDLFEWAEGLRAEQADDPSIPLILCRSPATTPHASTGSIQFHPSPRPTVICRTPTDAPSPALSPLSPFLPHDAVGLTSAPSTALFAVKVGDRQGLTAVEDLWRLAMPGRPLEDMERHSRQFVAALRDMSDTAGLHRYALSCSSRTGAVPLGSPPFPPPG